MYHSFFVLDFGNLVNICRTLVYLQKGDLFSQFIIKYSYKTKLINQLIIMNLHLTLICNNQPKTTYLYLTQRNTEILCTLHNIHTLPIGNVCTNKNENHNNLYKGPFTFGVFIECLSLKIHYNRYEGNHLLPQIVPFIQVLSQTKVVLERVFETKGTQIPCTSRTPRYKRQ